MNGTIFSCSDFLDIVGGHAGVVRFIPDDEGEEFATMEQRVLTWMKGRNCLFLLPTGLRIWFHSGSCYRRACENRAWDTFSGLSVKVCEWLATVCSDTSDDRWSLISNFFVTWLNVADREDTDVLCTQNDSVYTRKLNGVITMVTMPNLWRNQAWNKITCTEPCFLFHWEKLGRPSINAHSVREPCSHCFSLLQLKTSQRKVRASISWNYNSSGTVEKNKTGELCVLP